MIRDSGTGQSMVQVNHGRSGMFSFANYSPQTGTATEDMWSWDFDLFELMNSANVAAREELKLDFFSFLNHGQLKTPTGVSDSHSRTSPCGLGHTDVYLDSTDPSSVTTEQLRQALLDGHVVVSGGITLRASAGEAHPGDLLVGGEHQLDVVVRSPSWFQADVVRLIRNGSVVETVELGAEPVDETTGLWLETSFTLSDTEDSWYVVEAEGSTAMGHVWRGALPYAITNAFRVDVAGDGWDAPGTSDR